jgi:hypothetical protein
VTEEASSPITSANDKAPEPKAKAPVRVPSGEDLMEMATPIIPNNPHEVPPKDSTKAVEKESPQEVPVSEKTGQAGSDSTEAVVLETENLDEMKTVAI